MSLQRWTKLGNIYNTNTGATWYIVYHVIFDFLKHVIIGHNEVLGCVTISNVGQDAQRLTRYKIQFLHKWYLPVNKIENKTTEPTISNKVLINICLYSPVLWPPCYDQPRESELLPAWSASHENSWSGRYAADTSHHERKFEGLQVKKKKDTERHWWFKY